MPRRISKAIGHLREHFDEPLKVEEATTKFAMSASRAFTSALNLSRR
jgi:hypothetical protein